MKNFEKYTSAKERLDAFCDLCNRLGTLMEVSGFAQWLDLEVEEDKPMPCPFCGGDVEITDEGTMEEHLYCGCGYASRNACEDYDYIADHNRVCKAVAAYKEDN